MDKRSDEKGSGNRLLSLDAFRGITMFLLIAEGAHVYKALDNVFNPDSFLGQIVMQFHHHPWNGLRFWDLVQPFFMFIVGVAMAYSLNKRLLRGESWKDLTKHIVQRCMVLFSLGVILHCGYNHALVWELWNVLTQLSFTILVAFLIFRLPVKTQLVISFAMLIMTEFLYRFAGVAGFDQPFVQGQNFGSWMDMILMGKINGGGWVAINALPTAAHTIWGVLAGKFLLQEQPYSSVLKTFAIAGIIGLIAGYGMDLAGVTPIIKRIATSSFVIVSGGWCFLALAFLYWIIDVKKWGNWVVFFAIVGMNPIFIYLFSEVVAALWFNDYITIYTFGFLGWLGAGKPLMMVISAFIVLGIEWYLCYWLYKKKIFIKI